MANLDAEKFQTIRKKQSNYEGNRHIITWIGISLSIIEKRNITDLVSKMSMKLLQRYGAIVKTRVYQYYRYFNILKFLLYEVNL